MYTQVALQLVRAPRTVVYRALLDPQAIEVWRVPDNMTARVEQFDPREGGAFRVSLSYADAAADGPGKTEGSTDTYGGHFERLVPDEQVVELVEFDSADPDLQGPMRLTTTLRDLDGDMDVGTEVELVHEGIPDAIRPEDNAAGTRMSLAKLAAYVEGLGQAG